MADTERFLPNTYKYFARPVSATRTLEAKKEWMSYQDNADFRSRAAGGYAYSENHLWDIFQPLIESDGASVYLALTRMIPRAAIDPDRQVTHRSLEEASGVSRSQVARKLKEVIALGMITEIKNEIEGRPSSYQLHSLVELNDLGREELLRRLLAVIEMKELRRRIRKRLEFKFGEKRAVLDLELLSRIGDPPRVTGAEAGPANPAPDAGATPAQSLATAPDASSPTLTDLILGATAPEGSGENGDPGRVTELDPGQNGDFCGKTTEPENSVTHRKASVTHRKASVTHRKASVTQGERPLKQEVEVEVEKDKYPPTPASGGVAASTFPANAKAPNNGKNFAVEWQEPETVAELRDAVAKVLRECGLSGRRHQAVIERAMCAEAGMTDERPKWNAIAERMIEARQEYSRLGSHGLLRIGPYRLERFFGEHIWRETGLWGIDEQQLNERRRL